MTVSSVKRRRLTVRVSRAYARFIGWGRRHRWLFIVALIWGFGIPTFLLPEKIEPEKGETPGRGTELYNKIMEGRFMTEHRSFLDKFLGSSLHLFHTATSRYNNFREPEQKVLYVNAGMAEGCTVQQLNDVVRHMENYICQFDEVDMFRTRITSYDNARIEITFKPEYENSGFPSMLKQELTSAAINFGGATWRVWGIDDNSFNNNIVSSYRSNQIRLRGYNYDQLAAYADRLIDSLSTNRRVSEPEIMDGDAWTLPHNEFTIRYDDERIAATGLDVSDYYTILNTMLYQSRLPSVYNGEELQQVILESGDRDRFDRWHIANAQVGIDSLRTKLSTVGTIEKHRTGISIRRSKQSYEILVGFDFIGSYELGKRLIERTVRQLNDEILPIGFRADSPSHNFGRKEKQQQAWLILLVVAIIYTMCTQTAGHHSDDPHIVHRSFPLLRLVGLHLRPRRLRGIRPAVRHRRQCRHLSYQRGGYMRRDFRQAGYCTLPESFQPQNRPDLADDPLDDPGTRSIPVRRPRRGILVRIRHRCDQRDVFLRRRAADLPSHLPAHAP